MTTETNAAVPGCTCEACMPQGDPFKGVSMRFIVCALCGNKRCPHATDHRNACTNSNEPGQKGSSYEHMPKRGEPLPPMVTMCSHGRTSDEVCIECEDMAIDGVLRDWRNAPTGQLDTALPQAAKRIAELREAVEDLVHQFAYDTTTPDGPALWAGGLSALECAFAVLGWTMPHPIPEQRCDEPECKARATCGWPDANGTYRRTCGTHMPMLNGGNQ